VVSDRPALGFISLVWVPSAAELLGMHRKLSECATSHGLRLIRVYVERVGPPSAAFDLLGSLLKSDGQPLVVPTLHHLGALGNPAQIRDHLRLSGHDVMIADKQAERTC
jgi:hypothetical protein